MRLISLGSVTVGSTLADVDVQKKNLPRKRINGIIIDMYNIQVTEDFIYRLKESVGDGINHYLYSEYGQDVFGYEIPVDLGGGITALVTFDENAVSKRPNCFKFVKK